jgi:2-succinyl-6-hydroxy-2,4-cyclohexadiene-1-carboxylate synthase
MSSSLAATAHGPAPSDDRPPLVLAHGFTQHAGCWGPLLDDLAGDRRVVAVDLPGHGRSASITADLWRSADLLAEVGGHADYLGYSLGGRVCLHLALAHPQRVRRLVLIGATPGLPDNDTRAARRRSDEALADRLEHEPLEQFLVWWLGQPLFRTLPAERAMVAERTHNAPAALATSLRTCGTGVQQPLWDRLPQLAMPVLLLAGAVDHRFAAIAVASARVIGANASVSLVPGSGHACHLERPEAVGVLVRSFLNGTAA